ncbi:hypothetical protein TCAL_05701 [Tigriopus californicus]|uniref:Uncharacterized protein n=1 Tax=Tigriopus californicus TaxID=6832 RepID=A0A553N841_TIGCA|nr:hypothetical protein TCAL_05701 [Tigriopus californicus]
MEGMVPDEERGVATLGGRASLPTMYVENELNNSTVSNAHLRFRKISHEAPNSSNGRFNPCYGTPTTYCSSPRANHKTPDSGIEVSSSSLDTSPESLDNQSQSLRFPPHRNLYESETGDVLGGKKASIQYGHDLKNLQAKEETQRMLEVQAAKLEKIIETLALKEGDSEEVANEKKDLLLEKLRESGHFASSKIEPLDIDNVSPPQDHEVIIEKKPSPQIGPKLDDENNAPNSENPEPVKIRRKRVILQSKSANPLKEFRITELDGEKEDDPFRLL